MVNTREEDWELRNRVRYAVYHGAKVVRDLQLVSNVRDVEILRILVQVCRETKGSLIANYLEKIVEKIEPPQTRKKTKGTLSPGSIEIEQGKKTLELVNKIINEKNWRVKIDQHRYDCGTNIRYWALARLLDEIEAQVSAEPR